MLLVVRNRTPRFLLAPASLALFLLFASAAGRAETVFLQPIIVGTAIDHTVSDLAFADAIFAQMSLDFTMLPELTSSTLPTTMDDANLGAYLTDSTWQLAPVLTVWYVPAITGARGVSFGGTVGSTVRYGVAVDDGYANDTLAHEVGHVLLDFQCGTICYSGDPAHANDPNNLMAPGGSYRNLPTSVSGVYGQGGTYDQLTASQISLILQDQTGFLDTPEPVTAVSFLSGTAFVLCFRRVRRRKKA
jgi:hypothetical protein